MKGMKKLLSILMVLTLVLSLGATAFALDITVTEKKGGDAGTYKAYQLFTLTTTETNDAGEKKDGGSGYSYTVNPTYRDIMYKVCGLTGEKATDKELISYLEGLEGKEDGIREFADGVYKAIVAAGLGADYTSAEGKFTGVPQGYYLIAEEGAAGGATSQVMLDTAGREDITVTTKEDVPSSEKKVQDKNDTKAQTDDGKWQDSADWDIGDDVPFQLKATLPADTAKGYNTYEVVFHDVQSAGLTFNPESVKVYLNSTTTIPDDKYEVVTEGLTDGCTFHVVFEDILDVDGFEVGADNVITVDYTSKLNDGAVIGSAGNPNTLYLEYSNNPYSDGKGKTPNNKVIVFTYEFNAKKVDKDGEKLEGAGFTLLKKVESGGTTKTYNEGTSYEATYEGVVEVKSYTVAPGQTTFDFRGLDDGDYILVETTVPAGYNKADDVEFTITASHDEKADDPKLLTFQGKGDGIEVNEEAGSDTAISGKIDTDVVNLTGVELPETGGIGTTIFYIVGAVLVAGAVILLVTKKRVSGMEK